jgi:hypothetical protein
MCEAKAYDRYVTGSYKSAECKRAQNRSQRGCLTDNWKPGDLKGKSILVIGENGIGDEVLTIGCLPDLAPKCGSVFWRCDSKLKDLFTRSFPNVAFFSDHEMQPIVHGIVYSWELIGRFRESLDHFPCRKSGGAFVPYIKPLIPLKQCLSERYHDAAKAVVGLAWCSERDGKPQWDKTCDLRDVVHWADFFERLRDKVRFVSLQYGNTDDDVGFARWKYGVEIYQEKSLDIFSDVDAAAAQIAATDHVVSISTTAVHLAGALGKSGCVLLPKNAYGHWRAGEKKCPWYPQLTPLKQAIQGEWKTVLEGAADNIIEVLSGNGLPNGT